jgi:syntaxin 16
VRLTLCVCCSSSPHAVIGLPPAWVDLSEEITVNIHNAKKKMVELSKLHERALMPSFGDGKEDHHAIDELTQDITSLLKRSEKRLMKLASNMPSEDSNVRKNVQVVYPSAIRFFVGICLNIASIYEYQLEISSIN